MKKRTTYLFFLCISVALVSGCKDNFPRDLDAFSLDMNYSQQEYTPVLGRNTVYQGNFNSGESSLPLSFRISAVRTFDGREAPELLKLFPVPIWTERYTGEETSLKEIRAKRDTVMRPLWEIGEHSGSFTMWETATSNILKVYPDSGYVFDVEVSSSGGRRYFRDLKLKPQLEEPFSQSIVLTTGGIIGDETRTPISGINVWFNRKGNGSSITFKALNPDLSPIPLDKFNTTDWDNLLHGFNKTFASDMSEVTYDVEYPIPLVPSVHTKYTNGVGQALARLSFDRIGYGGDRLAYSISFPFSIYQRGDWEVIIYFPDEAPLFDND